MDLRSNMPNKRMSMRLSNVLYSDPVGLGAQVEDPAAALNAESGPLTAPFLTRVQCAEYLFGTPR